MEGVAMSGVTLTYWPSVRTPQGRRFTTTRSRFMDRCRIPLVVDDKLRLAGWSATTFASDYRKLDNVLECAAIGLDLDGEGADLDVAREALADLCGFLYTSFSHTPEKPRGRAILWTSRPVTAAEYYRCWRWVARRLPFVGQEAKDPSRLWFVPGCPPIGEFDYRMLELRGAMLDVEEALASEPAILDARDYEPSPQTPRSAGVPPVRTSTYDRAKAYVSRCGPAISGSGGHNQTFVMAQRLVRGFALSEDAALSLLMDWNATCVPPWSLRDLKRKIHEAATSGRMQVGDLAADRPMERR